MRPFIRQGVPAAVAFALLAAARPAPAQDGTAEFQCVNGPQVWMVPAGVDTITVDAFGAQGGNGPDSVAADVGGLGGQATATFAVTSGETLQINVGCKGGDGPENPGPGGAGGFNGGGTGGTADANGGGAGGGGASDVRRGAFSLADRLIVAGGGGGAGGGVSSCGGGAGGDGGGLTGADGEETGCPAFGGDPGLGGTDTAGGDGGAGSSPGGESGDDGSAGVGGAGGASVMGDLEGSGGGGGGGGFFGGGGGGGAQTDVGSAKGSGGGGGSGFGPPGTVFATGVRAGDGLIRITPGAAAVPAMSRLAMVFTALLLGTCGMLAIRRASRQRRA